MKKLLLAIIILCIHVSSFAQPKPITVGIMPLRYSNEDYAERAEELTEIITSTFSQRKKITVLDRDKINLIKKELDLQKKYEFTDGLRVPQKKAYGAEVLVTGKLTRIAVEKKSIAGKFGNSSVTISFSLQAFDVTTGKLLKSEFFDLKGGDGSMAIDGGAYSVSADPMKNAIFSNKKKIMIEIQNFISSMYPPAIKIATIDKTDKKGRPQLVSVISPRDEDIDIKVGTSILISEITEVEIDGDVRTREVVICKLQVTELQGDFVQCEVIEGEDVIEEKRKNAKLKYIVSAEPPARAKPKLFSK